jgi:xylose isomerase
MDTGIFAIVLTGIKMWGIAGLWGNATSLRYWTGTQTSRLTQLFSFISTQLHVSVHCGTITSLSNKNFFKKRKGKYENTLWILRAFMKI